MWIQASIDILAPVEKIWRLIDDQAERRRWMGADAGEIEYLGMVDPTNKFGARFKSRYVAGGKTVEFEGEVTEHRPPHAAGVRLWRDKYHCWDYSYILESIPGGTRLVCTRVMQTDKFPLLVRLMFVIPWLLLDRRDRRKMQQGLARLKAVAEQGDT
jgi:hypothetical protein